MELNKNPATGCQNEKFVSKKNIHIYGPRDVMDISWALVFVPLVAVIISPFHHSVVVVASSSIMYLKTSLAKIKDTGGPGKKIPFHLVTWQRDVGSRCYCHQWFWCCFGVGSRHVIGSDCGSILKKMSKIKCEKEKNNPQGSLPSSSVMSSVVIVEVATILKKSE